MSLEDIYLQVKDGKMSLIKFLEELSSHDTAIRKDTIRLLKAQQKLSKDNAPY